MKKGWYITLQPIITADWRASSGNVWTVPFGGGLGRIMKIGFQPVNISGQFYGNAAYATEVHPGACGCDCVPVPEVHQGAGEGNDGDEAEAAGTGAAAIRTEEVIPKDYRYCDQWMASSESSRLRQDIDRSISAAWGSLHPYCSDSKWEIANS